MAFIALLQFPKEVLVRFLQVQLSVGEHQGILLFQEFMLLFILRGGVCVGLGVLVPPEHPARTAKDMTKARTALTIFSCFSPLENLSYSFSVVCVQLLKTITLTITWN